MLKFLEFELFELRWDYLSNSEPPYLVLKAKTNQLWLLECLLQKLRNIFTYQKNRFLKAVLCIHFQYIKDNLIQINGDFLKVMNLK